MTLRLVDRGEHAAISHGLQGDRFVQEAIFLVQEAIFLVQEAIARVRRATALLHDAISRVQEAIALVSEAIPLFREGRRDAAVESSHEIEAIALHYV